MTYITLEELKEILPEIMRDWIDKDDESWEWIFQEIEQKCRGGKKKKESVNCETCKYFVSNNGVGYCDGGMPCYGHSRWEKKKDKKPKKKDMQNAMEIAIMAHRNDINELTKKVDGLERDTTILSARISTLASSVEGVKWIAQTAKQRTEVDYSKYSGKSDGKISYSNPEDKDCKSCKYYSDTEAIKSPCSVCEDYQYWEAKDE